MNAASVEQKLEVVLAPGGGGILTLLSLPSPSASKGGPAACRSNPSEGGGAD